MKILIAEDDRVSRVFLEKFMSGFGTCDVAVDGMEALDLFMESMKNKEPYDLACLDIMMPKVDGIKLVKVIRTMEKQQGVAAEDRVRIIMMTALADVDYVDRAPLQYSQIFWAILFGALFYAEFPAPVAYIGLAIIVVAGILNVVLGETSIRIFSRNSPAGSGPAALNETSPEAVLEAPIAGAAEATSKT